MRLVLSDWVTYAFCNNGYYAIFNLYIAKRQATIEEDDCTIDDCVVDDMCITEESYNADVFDSCFGK